ncbi:hypothetical protein AO501_07560 [Mycobacterium gordonae]|uniref:Uncharacterized protein n=1 Tax=Mycobacterium gordonae TaxID=1778 RepID=A0A0Q2R5X8_MYCGO|nr:hypothetical protein AO501_07560 [Mycobacterium gordonae]
MRETRPAHRPEGCRVHFLKLSATGNPDHTAVAQQRTTSHDIARSVPWGLVTTVNRPSGKTTSRKRPIPTNGDRRHMMRPRIDQV